MKSLSERNADFFEKLAVALFAAAFVAPVALYVRGVLAITGTLAYMLMVMLTVTATTRTEEHDGERT